MTNHQPYFLARAAEERERAMASANPKARAVHLEMAAKYAALAEARPAQVSVNGERQTG